MNPINPNSDTNGEFTTTGNPYRYNGKAYVANELDWLDNGARFYDAAIARFTSIDPLAEKNHVQSGFAYAANNPILCMDYMGLYNELHIKSK
jgi:RHS repeat-associated protein